MLQNHHQHSLSFIAAQCNHTKHCRIALVTSRALHFKKPHKQQQQQHICWQRFAPVQAALHANSNMDAPQSSAIPLLVGLTGSIGMGKSTVSGFLGAHEVPVLCADDVVHRLYAVGGAAVGPVGAAFPIAVVEGAIDRAQLSKCVVGNEAAMKRLEDIVHPLVAAARLKFIQQHAAAGAPVVVFDIPLLYETKAEQQLDVVLVVSAPADVQRQRVLAREGMTPEKLAAILARQVPDEEKRQRADFVIDTGCSLEQTEQQVASVLQELQGSAAARLLGSAVESEGSAGQRPS